MLVLSDSDLTEGGSCPCFVVLGQYVTWKHSLTELSHVTNGWINTL